MNFEFLFEKQIGELQHAIMGTMMVLRQHIEDCELTVEEKRSIAASVGLEWNEGV